MLLNFFNLYDFKKTIEKTENLKKDWLDIRIFSRKNLESILISRMITYVFKSNFISFQLYPIDTLKSFNDYCRYFYYQPLQYIKLFLINFGGDLNLVKFIDINKPIFSCIYVFDLNCFLHFENIFSQKIFIFKKKANILENKKKRHKKNKDKFHLNQNQYKNFEKNIYFFSDFLNKNSKKQIQNIWLNIIKITYYYLFEQITIFLNKKLMKKIENNLNIIRKKLFKINNKNFFFYENSNFFYLKKKKELPFNFLRHFIFLDVIVNTPKFAIQFNLWKIKGIKKISQLFLRLGLSLKETLQPWCSIEIIKRKFFKSNIKKEAFRFGVSILKYDSFIKNFNSPKKKNFTQKILSAADFNHAIDALMDYELFKGKKKKEKKFWRGYNSFSDYKELKIGIGISQKIQKFVSKICKIILSKKTYIPEKLFCYTYLKNMQFFKVTFEMLKRLAFYLMLAFSNKKIKNKKFFFFFIPLKKILLMIGFFPQQIIFPKENNNNEFKKQMNFLGALIDEDGFFFLEMKENDDLKILKILKKI